MLGNRGSGGLWVLFAMVIIIFLAVGKLTGFATITATCNSNDICDAGEDAIGCPEDCNANLLINPGFENDSNLDNQPDNWTQGGSGGSKILDSIEKHSGNYSWKLTQNDILSFQVVYSNKVMIEEGKFYELSGWLKSQTGNEKVSFAWRELDENSTSLAFKPFLIDNTNISTIWQRYNGIAKPLYSRAKYLQVQVLGPRQSNGTIWLDDFALRTINSNTCNNNSLCEEFRYETSLNCPNDCLPRDNDYIVYENSNYSVWSANTQTKILPVLQPPQQNASNITIRLAKNEVRTKQIAITSQIETEINNISIINNNENINITFYLEELVNISNPRDNNIFIGNIPDPLIRATAINLTTNNTRTLLLEVSANRAATGVYEATLSLDDVNITLFVEIYEFTLPDVLGLKTAFDSGLFTTRYTSANCTSNSVFDFHNVSNDRFSNQAIQVVTAYYDDYAENKIVPYKPQYPFTFPAYNCATQTFDFTDLDSTLEHYLDDLHMNSVMIRHFTSDLYSNGFRMCSKNITEPDYATVAIPYFTKLAEHLETKGWLNKSIIMIDEPTGINLNYTRDFANIITKNVTPTLRVGAAMHTFDAYNALENASNLWIILNDDLSTKYIQDKAIELANKGDEIWWYTIRTDAFDIDSDAVDNIAFAWRAWKYNIKGALFWAGFLYDLECRIGVGEMANPWDNPRSHWGNGQVTFYYPPCKEGTCTQPTYDVVPSLRIKLFREGIEDYEYFKILNNTIEEARQVGIQTTQAEAILLRVNEIALTPTTWNQDPSLIQEVREEVARSIENLKAQFTCDNDNICEPHENTTSCPADCDQDNDGLNDLSDPVIGSLTGYIVEINDSTNTSHNYSTNQTVRFKKAGNTLIEFDYNFSIGQLDLNAISITTQSGGAFGSLQVNGLNLTGTKTVYVDRIAGSNNLCIIDSNSASISEITSGCTLEISLSCPGTSGQYSCLINGSSYVVSGLSHTALTEYSTSSSGSSSTTSFSGGGFCEDQWSCSEWNVCSDGYQIRNCTLIASCQQNPLKPEETKPCEIVENVEPVVIEEPQPASETPKPISEEPQELVTDEIAEEVEPTQKKPSPQIPKIAWIAVIGTIILVLILSALEKIHKTTTKNKHTLLKLPAFQNNEPKTQRDNDNPLTKITALYKRASSVQEYKQLREIYVQIRTLYPKLSKPARSILRPKILKLHKTLLKLRKI